MVKENQKYFTSPAPKAITAAQLLLNALAERDQHLTIHRVAKVIIDRLEVINVAEDQRQGFALAIRVIHRLLDGGFQMAAVPDPCEPLGGGQGQQLLIDGRRLQAEIFKVISKTLVRNTETVSTGQATTQH